MVPLRHVLGRCRDGHRDRLVVVRNTESGSVSLRESAHRTLVCVAYLPGCGAGSGVWDFFRNRAGLRDGVGLGSDQAASTQLHATKIPNDCGQHPL